MSLKVPEILEHYWHDDIVKAIMRMNPQCHRPNRGSWPEGIPDLEDADRRVVEVALTDLRNAWGQCLYYYRMNAKQIHLVLAPRLYLDYQNKEKAFIRANPIPNVEVYSLPEIRIKSFLRSRKPKAKPKWKAVPVPELNFIVTDEEKTKALVKQVGSRYFRHLSHPSVKEPKEEPVIDTKQEYIPDEEDPELIGDVDLEKHWATKQPKPFKQVFTKKHCVDCEQFKVENNMGVCPKYNWEIALDLAERDAVCEEL